MTGYNQGMTISEIPAQDLPLWMRRARRGVDWGVLISISMCLLAALSFLTEPGLPRTNSSENYVFRADDYAQAISEGYLYPRWSPHVLGGYGAPIPSFYPPGPAYVPALIQFFFTGDPVSAVRIVYAASIVLAGSALYAFVTRRMGAAAGVLASALYVFSPYLSLVAPHVLGDLPAVMSLALLPSLLWSFDRLMFDQRNTDLLLVGLCIAGLLLTEPRYALVGLLLAGAYLVWIRGLAKGNFRLRRALLAGLLGVGCATFFWFPALQEQSAITWRSAADAAPLFLSIAGLLAPLRPVDPNELVHTPQLALGLPLVVFTIATVVIWAMRRRLASFQRLFLGLAAALLAVGGFVLPRETWLLGPVVLCLAISGTAALEWKARPPRLLFPALFALALALSIPGWLRPRWSDTFGAVDPLTQVQYEQLGYGTAVLPAGMALPSTIAPDLLRDQMLVSSYSANSISKIALSPGFQIGVLRHSTHGDQFQIESQTSGTLRILTAYFPGWTATLDSMPLRLQPDGATGLINIDIPSPASGTLTVTLGTTSVRTAAWIISFASLIVLAWVAFRPSNRTEDSFVELYLLSVPETRLATLVVLVAGSLMLLFTPPVSPFSMSARAGYGLDGSTELGARTEVGLEALSFRLDNQQLQAGSSVHLTLYWRALRFLPANYRTQILLMSLSSGERRAVTDLRHPGYYPTRRWLTNRYVTDTYQLSLPQDTAPGEYAFAVEVFDCPDECSASNRLTFFSQNGETLGQTLVLPDTVTLAR